MVMKYASFIRYSSLLHLGWAVCIYAHQGPLKIVATESIRALVPGYELRVALFSIAALLAWWHTMEPKPGDREKGLLSLALGCGPQQVLLMMSATDALTCAYNGQYADGYIAPRLFILADQLPHVLGSILHTFAVLHYYGSVVRRRNK